jgi:hypothetical protein
MYDQHLASPYVTPFMISLMQGKIYHPSLSFVDQILCNDHMHHLVSACFAGIGRGKGSKMATKNNFSSLTNLPESDGLGDHARTVGSVTVRTKEKSNK